MPGGPSWEAWAQPPLHTGKPALYLNDHPAGTLELPRGTRVQVRLYKICLEWQQNVGLW